MMVSTCSNELKFMSERERSTKPALNGYTNPDFRELRPVDPSDGVPLSRTRVHYSDADPSFFIFRTASPLRRFSQKQTTGS